MIIFLTVPAELTLWRKQTNVEVIEEFEGKRISKKFISDWSPNNVKIWAHAEKSLAGIQHQWEKVTLLVERFERRKQLYNNDNLKLVQVLGSLSLEPIYTVQPSDVSSIDQGLRGVARHLTTSSSLIQDETQLIEDGILSEFKEYNEYLVCLAGLFERNHRLGGNRIEEIKKKVEASQARLIQLKKKSDAKGSDIDALVSTINEDKQEIIRQSNRDWLIKECILQEFSLFQQTQYKVSKLFQEWVADRLKYSELHCENWSQLGELLQEMPTNHE